MTIQEIIINGSIGNQTFTVEVDSDTVIEVSLFDSNNGILVKIVENEIPLVESSPAIDGLPIMLPIRSYNLIVLSSAKNADSMTIEDFGNTLKMLLVQNV